MADPLFMQRPWVISFSLDRLIHIISQLALEPPNQVLIFWRWGEYRSLWRMADSNSRLITAIVHGLISFLAVRIGNRSD